MSNADQIHLQWNSVGDPFVTDYFLYAGNPPVSTNSYFFRLSVPAIPGPTQSSYVTVPNGYWNFWVTSAYQGGPESPPSLPLETPVPPDVTCFLLTSESIILYGGFANLIWTVSGAATYANISGIGNVSLVGGSQIVAPTVTTSYVLTVANAVSTNTCETTITVLPPLAVSVVANPSTVLSNSLSTISWTTTGPCATLVIDNGVGSVSCSGGNYTFTGITNTLFTAIASDSFGNTVTNTALLTVVQPPTPPIIPGGLAAIRKAIMIR